MKKYWPMLKQTAAQWNTHNVPRLGAALAFYTILSIAPLVVVVVAIASFVFGESAARGQIIWQIQDMVGQQGAAAIQTMLQNAHKPGTGIVASVFGVLMLLIGASAVFGELRDSLNLIWESKQTAGSGIKGMLKYRFFSFSMVLGIGFLLLVSLVISASLSYLGGVVGNYFPLPEFLLQVASLLILFAVITVLFALIYKFVPDVHIDWNDVWIGAAFTSLLFSLGKLLIGLYIGKASVGSAYGAAGSLVILLVWIYYSSQIFFFGAEFTHVYAVRQGSRKRERIALPEQAFAQAPGLAVRH